jgi:hypothetical protein
MSDLHQRIFVFLALKLFLSSRKNYLGHRNQKVCSVTIVADPGSGTVFFIPDPDPGSWIRIRNKGYGNTLSGCVFLSVRLYAIVQYIIKLNPPPLNFVVSI